LKVVFRYAQGIPYHFYFCPSFRAPESAFGLFFIEGPLWVQNELSLTLLFSVQPSRFPPQDILFFVFFTFSITHRTKIPLFFSIYITRLVPDFFFVDSGRFSRICPSYCLSFHLHCSFFWPFCFTLSIGSFRLLHFWAKLSFFVGCFMVMDWPYLECSSRGNSFPCISGPLQSRSPSLEVRDFLWWLSKVSAQWFGLFRPTSSSCSKGHS